LIIPDIVLWTSNINLQKYSFILEWQNVFFQRLLKNNNDLLKWAPGDRRRIAERSLALGLKISDLQFCMIHTRNALVFRRYVIATKKGKNSY
jgi:hypothetical protein